MADAVGDHWVRMADDLIDVVASIERDLSRLPTVHLVRVADAFKHLSARCDALIGERGIRGD